MMLSEDDELNAAIKSWIDKLVESVSSAAAQAFAAGTFHASGQIHAGISWDVAQQDALDYMVNYKKRLVEDGVLEVTVPVFDSDGRITGHTTEELPWLKNKSAEMKSEIVGIIERGIREGRATGVKIDEFGNYPDGSIAADLDAYCSMRKSSAATVARTETARCYYNGEVNRYADAGVRYVQYLGAPDACDECQPYIGQIFVLGSEPHLPLHPNCRCDYRPYYPALGEIVNCGDGKKYLHTDQHTILVERNTDQE